MIMKMVFKAENFIDLIPAGKDNAISAEKLACLMNCSERRVRKCIEQLRRNGVLICSTCRSRGGGYYRPRDSMETAAYVERQLSRIGSIWKALSPFKQYLKALPVPGQVALDELAKGGEDNGCETDVCGSYH